MPEQGHSKRFNAFRLTEKWVQAKMKNRREESRLLVKLKLFDQEQSQASRSIEKEKFKAIQDFRKMQDISGVSPLGQAPDGPNDIKHLRSPYFTEFRYPSGNQLERWRLVERELEKMLAKDSMLLVPPWEWDSDQDISKNFAKMMRLLGYDVGNDDVVDELHNVCRTVSTSDDHSADVADCDGGDADDNSGSVADLFSYQLDCGSVRSAPSSAADITRKMDEDYKQLVAQPGYFTKSRHEPSKTASRPLNKGMDRDGKLVRVESQTAPFGQDSRSVSNVVQYRSRCPAATTVATPLTVHPTTGSKPDKMQSLIIAEKCNHQPVPKYQNRPKATNSNDTKSKRGRSGDRRPGSQQSMASRLVSKRSFVRPHTATGSRTDDVCQASKSRPSSAVVSRCVIVGHTTIISRNNSQEGTVHSGDKNPLNDKSNNPNRYRKYGTTSNANIGNVKKVGSEIAAGDSVHEIRQTILQNDSKFLLHAIVNTAEKFSTTKDLQVDSNSPHGADMVQRIVCYAKKLDDANKQSCIMSGIDVSKLEKKLQDIASVCDSNVEGLFYRVSQRKGSHLQNAPHKIEDYCRSLSSFANVDPLEDIVLSDQEDEEENPTESIMSDDIVDGIPRWKMDLMRESPPGITFRSPNRALIAMDNMRQQKELDGLLWKHASDVKTIIAKEQARKIRARLHLYFTMIKLDEAVAKITHHL